MRTTAGTATGHGDGHLRLLITDPLHPVTASTVAGLRRGCRECRVVGIVPGGRSSPPPPSVDTIVTCAEPDAPEYIDTVLRAATSEDVDTVLPWTDRDALAISRRADRLADHGVTVVCPPWPLVGLACDKWSTVQRLAEIGVAVPRSVGVGSGEELTAAAEQLGYPRRSLVLKPRGLAGGAGVWFLRAEADLVATVPRPQLPVEAMAVALDRVSAHASGVGYVLQQEVRGTDVSVDVLAHEGRVVAAVARTREATLGGLCVEGRVMPLAPPLAELVAAVVSGLSWSSLANIQLVLGERGAVVYEINARASGSIGSALHAGLDLLSAAIVQHRTGAAPDDIDGCVAQPIRFRRYWQDQWWPAR